MTDLMFVLAGPIVWAAHFFAVYLTQALLCPTQGPATHVPVVSAGALSVLALVAMLVIAMRQHGDGSLRRRHTLLFALPLTLLAALAVVWTTLPIFVLPTCAPGGA
jgi:hypothetical protein